jgi:predicted nucleic acid-binding protein
LNEFFNKKDNYSKSKYEELEEKYDLYKKIEKYIDYKKDEKIIFFNEIYKLLEFNDNKLLDNFNINKDRKDELESDLK